MTERDTHSVIYAPPAAKAMLASLAEQAAHTACKEPWHGPQALRVEVPVRRTDALAWLRAQSHESKAYWEDRAGEARVAATGRADIVRDAPPERAFAHMRTILSNADANLRYYGGMAFQHGGGEAAADDGLGALHFVLPRFELTCQGGRSHLACNLVLSTKEDPDAVLADVLSELDDVAFPKEAPATAIPAPRAREDWPDTAGWAAMVKQALAALAGPVLDKVVLARESRFRFDAPLDALALLTRLAPHCPSTYRFCFQPSPGVAFLGATPERLYSRRGRHVESEAMAGTRPRGDSRETDQALGEELLSADKERREHLYVQEAVRNALAGLCRSVHVAPEVTVRKLARVQHLYCHVEGILHTFESDAALLEALHPTPAVGGVPVADALECIQRLEPFDRGWYAGPVGWVGRDSAEFAVAIRAGLVRRNTLSLYSGAGIVAGSIPAAEWEEIEAKMGTFLSVLTGHED